MMGQNVEEYPEYRGGVALVLAFVIIVAPGIEDLEIAPDLIAVRETVLPLLL
ncbi:hypothetical protein Micbo1qcDRAFT_167674, partial [Microdochium bolleyi]